MQFDVASVKQDTAAPSPQTQHFNIPPGPQDAFTPTGGLLSMANFPLITYMVFAYKLTPDQTQAILSQLPKWANTERYDIEARATGNPTKDQYRMMMQALLADRFKLAIHYETKQLPVFAMVLDKSGKLGPQLKPYPDGSPCDPSAATSSAAAPSATVADGFPANCGGFNVMQPSTPGRVRVGARNIPMTRIATYLPQWGNVDRPILDKTELAGTYDFVIEWTPEVPPGANFQPDESGPTFLEALKEQLGLKLDSQTGSVDSIVVDHIQQPSEN
jgi:uncharacterized protein (TIGR03435 family)